MRKYYQYQSFQTHNLNNFFSNNTLKLSYALQFSFVTCELYIPCACGAAFCRCSR